MRAPVRHEESLAFMWAYRLADHFSQTAPNVKEVFERFRKLARECGPVTVYAQKARIVFQVRVRFAGAMTRKPWLVVSLWLTDPAKHPHLRRV